MGKSTYYRIARHNLPVKYHFELWRKDCKELEVRKKKVRRMKLHLCNLNSTHNCIYYDCGELVRGNSRLKTHMSDEEVIILLKTIILKKGKKVQTGWDQPLHSTENKSTIFNYKTLITCKSTISKRKSPFRMYSLVHKYWTHGSGNHGTCWFTLKTGKYLQMFEKVESYYINCNIHWHHCAFYRPTKWCL